MEDEGVRVTVHLPKLVPSKMQHWRLHTEGGINFMKLFSQVTKQIKQVKKQSTSPRRVVVGK